MAKENELMQTLIVELRSELRTGFANVTAAVGETNQRLDKLDSSVGQRLDKLDSRVGETNQRLNKLDLSIGEKLDGIAAFLLASERNMDGVERRLLSLENRVNKIERDQSA